MRNEFNTSPPQPALITAYLSKSVKLITASRDTMTDQRALVSTSVCERSGERGCCERDALIMEPPEIVCMRCRGSGGHGQSPVPTTQRLCPPPSINRDGHSYIPPIHQSSQHNATGGKKRERAGLLFNQTETLKIKQCRGDYLWLSFSLIQVRFCSFFLVSESHNAVINVYNKIAVGQLELISRLHPH